MKKQDSYVTTSLKIDPELKEQAKILAIKTGATLQELVNVALRKEIEEQKKKLAKKHD